MLFTKFRLTNGLTVIHHPDPSTRLAVMNILYRVGSRDEDPQHTGFAHLFEHLMFGGSKHIPDYDSVLQLAGGDNNAFTSNDITNYYLTLPYNNLETGFWLESDRMLQLDFKQESLDIQKNVVQEEFKERYLNQPYGDLWLHLLPLAYQTHPYSWPTIGKTLSHIADATLEQVESFFYRFYCPANAILVVAGNVTEDETRRLCEKWFSDIPAGTTNPGNYPAEPKQLQARRKEIAADVPQSLIVKAYHMPGRNDEGYYGIDLFSDILGMGKSSRLYSQLVRDERIFSEIDCYITGDADPGLMVIEGKVLPGIDPDKAESRIHEVIDQALHNATEQELEKVKNKTETNIRFNDTGALNRAMKLAYCEMLGDINMAVEEATHYRQVARTPMLEAAAAVISENNCSTILYHPES